MVGAVVVTVLPHQRRLSCTCEKLGVSLGNSPLLRSWLVMLRSGGLKVRLAQVDCVGEFKDKGSGRVFGNDQR